jgi:hypothetical protein
MIREDRAELASQELMDVILPFYRDGKTHI